MSHLGQEECITPKSQKVNHEDNLVFEKIEELLNKANDFEDLLSPIQPKIDKCSELILKTLQDPAKPEIQVEEKKSSNLHSEDSENEVQLNDVTLKKSSSLSTEKSEPLSQISGNSSLKTNDTDTKLDLEEDINSRSVHVSNVEYKAKKMNLIEHFGD